MRSRGDTCKRCWMPHGLGDGTWQWDLPLSANRKVAPSTSTGTRRGAPHALTALQGRADDRRGRSVPRQVVPHGTPHGGGRRLACPLSPAAWAPAQQGGRKGGQLERERLGGTPLPKPLPSQEPGPISWEGLCGRGGDWQGTAGALGHDPLRWDIQSHRSPHAVPSGMVGGVKGPRSSLLGHSLHSFTRSPALRAGTSGASGAAARAWPCLSRNPADPTATPRKPDPG